MTDRELLELAAKAAGIKLKPLEIKNVTEQGDDRFIGFATHCEQWSRGWFNPLANDGDALRLAVKLGLLVDCASHCARPLPDSIEWQEGSGPDDCANTRRAIVRAAAEIGKGMK